MDNQLQLAVTKAGMEAQSPKAKALLEQFSDYFELAADWENKAATIVVTDASQTAEMKMARAGRLFLRDMRIKIEKKRKDLKEQSLREGKAIDGMANILKALIVPIEEHLAKQEKFVEIKAAEEAEKLRLEADAKAEKERIAKEKAEAEERERIRLENEKLKKEAEEKELQLAAEKAKADAEKLRAAKKLKAEQDKAKAEADRIEAEREVERQNALADKMKATEERANLEAKLKTQITCPHCGEKLYPDGSKALDETC